MLFIDLNTAETITAADLCREYHTFKAEDPENHAESFKAEYFNIIMATINGRNDIDIVGQTPREIENIITRIRKTL